MVGIIERNDGKGACKISRTFLVYGKTSELRMFIVEGNILEKELPAFFKILWLTYISHHIRITIEKVKILQVRRIIAPHNQPGCFEDDHTASLCISEVKW